MLYVVATVLACLASSPTVCTTHQLPSMNDATGEPMTWGECLGVGGQVALMRFREENPHLLVKGGPRCTVGNGPKLLDRVLQKDGTPI